MPKETLAHNDDLVQALCDSIATGMYVNLACQSVGIGTSTLHEWTKAISEGEVKIDTLAVACIDADEQPIFPCGVSRQRMSEFGTENVIVVHKGESNKYKFEDVLPFDNKIKFSD